MSSSLFRCILFYFQFPRISQQKTERLVLRKKSLADKLELLQSEHWTLWWCQKCRITPSIRGVYEISPRCGKLRSILGEMALDVMGKKHPESLWAQVELRFFWNQKMSSLVYWFHACPITDHLHHELLSFHFADNYEQAEQQTESSESRN